MTDLQLVWYVFLCVLGLATVAGVWLKIEAFFERRKVIRELKRSFSKREK